VTAYDETAKKFSPENIESLFQYVLFVGLHNAISELERRKRAWGKERKNRQETYESEKRHLERAKEEHREWAQQNVLGKFIDWLDDKGKDYHEKKLKDYHADAVNAAGKYDSSRESIEQIDERLQVASLFYQRILSSNLIYRLTHLNGQEGFYQQGFPIKDGIERSLWWRRRCKEGEPTNKPEATI
jgi:hypothetical protein